MGMSPTAFPQPSTTWSDPTAPPSHGACPTAPDPADPTGEYGPGWRRKECLMLSWKIKLSHARNWREKKMKEKKKPCYFKSSTLQRLYSARCLSTIWLEKFKRSQQTAEYLQTGNEPTFRARARNTLSKQPVFLAPKTSETMGWRMEFYVCKAFSELA